MSLGKIFPGLHLGEAAYGSLELETEPLAGVKGIQGYSGGGDELHPPVVELVYQGDETARRVLAIPVQAEIGRASCRERV